LLNSFVKTRQPNMYAFFGFGTTPPKNNKTAGQHRQSHDVAMNSPSQMSSVHSPSSYGSSNEPDSPAFSDNYVPRVGSNLCLTLAEEEDHHVASVSSPNRTNPRCKHCGARPVFDKILWNDLTFCSGECQWSFRIYAAKAKESELQGSATLAMDSIQ
jgi:hypothetical protein